MIQIMIADDHAIVRSGLKQILELASDIKVIAEATNGSEVQEYLRQNSFDLVLMDMTMPGISGLDLITRIRAHHPNQQILVLSMHNEPQIVARAIKAGANGYLTKDSDPEKLISAIRKVATGGRVIDSALIEQIAFESFLPDQQLLHAKLSDREFEIFCLLASGKGVNEIAGQLNISNKTVSTHKVRMFERMNFSGMADLVRYAVQHNLP